MENIQIIQDLIAPFPERTDRPAILALQKDDSACWTYADLSDHGQRRAYGLCYAGLAPGDGGAMLAPNDPAWIIACLGSMQAGGVVILLDTQGGPLLEPASARLINSQTTEDSAAGQVETSCGSILQTRAI